MQLLSQVFSAKTAHNQLFTICLSICKNFSLSFLWKASHKKLGETQTKPITTE